MYIIYSFFFLVMKNFRNFYFLAQAFRKPARKASSGAIYKKKFRKFSQPKRKNMNHGSPLFHTLYIYIYIFFSFELLFEGVISMKLKSPISETNAL